MNKNYMFGKEVAKMISDRICTICQRVIQDGREGGWCLECFSEWYDGDTDDETRLNPLMIANKVRSKHNLKWLNRLPSREEDDG